MSTPNVNNLLPRLQRWYEAQCDGEWEHAFGVKIGTLDNPGWKVDINLSGTDLEDRTFVRVERALDKPQPNDEWLTCYVAERRFLGFGGSDKLAEIIAMFLEWAERPAEPKAGRRR